MDNEWRALDIHPKLTVGELVKQCEGLPPDVPVRIWDYLAPEFKQSFTYDGRSAEPHFRLPFGYNTERLGE